MGCFQHLKQLPYFAGLRVVGASEDHQDIVRDEPLGSPTQGRQPPSPDVPANGFLAYLEICRRLGHGELLRHRHRSVPGQFKSGCCSLPQHSVTDDGQTGTASV